jgi:hypothetical protein
MQIRTKKIYKLPKNVFENTKIYTFLIILILRNLEFLCSEFSGRF